MNLLVFLILCGCVYAQEITIGLTEWIGNSVTIIAKEKGFWKNEGLNVSLNIYESAPELSSAIDNGIITIAADMLGTVVRGVMNGKKYRVLLNTNWSDGGDKMIIKYGTLLPLKKNTVIGVYSTSPAVLFFLDRYLSSQKMNFNDYKIESVFAPTLTEEFIKNKFSIILNYDPYALNAIAKGNGNKVSTTKAFSGVMPEGLYTHASTLKKISQKTLMRFYMGWYKALVWCQNKKNSKEFMDLINKNLFVTKSPYNFRVLKFMRQGVKFHTNEVFIEENEINSKKYISSVLTFLKRTNQSSKFINPNSIININFSSDLKEFIRLN